MQLPATKAVDFYKVSGLFHRCELTLIKLLFVGKRRGRHSLCQTLHLEEVTSEKVHLAGVAQRGRVHLNW